jgi:hypothetical protein
MRAFPKSRTVLTGFAYIDEMYVVIDVLDKALIIRR